MSRIHRLGALLALALASAWPGALEAQQTEEELIRHLEEVVPLLDGARLEMEEAVRRQEAALRASQQTSVDTFMVGPLHIVAPLDLVGQATEMFGKVWEEEFAHFVSGSPALDETLLTFNWSAQPSRIVMTGPHHRAEARTWHRRAEVERRVREAIGRTLEVDLRRGARGVARWAAGAVSRPQAPEWLYRELATKPSRATRECLDGVTGACWSALGIEVDEGSLFAWYTPQERQDLALTAVRWTRENVPYRDACTRGDFDRCDEFFAEYANAHSLIPLPGDARLAMTWIALDMGGEGAWNRLLEDPSMEAAEALIYASGASRQELEAAWRSMVIEHKPGVHAGLSVSKWTALFWILIFAALAMRSTRWRLA